MSSRKYVTHRAMFSSSAFAGHVNEPQAGLDISRLERDVQKYFELGLAASTKKTYRAGINKFVQFCVSYNIASPLPVSQSVLCLFISHLANVGLSYGTIKTYLAAVRHLQISIICRNPDQFRCLSWRWWREVFVTLERRAG